MQSERDPATVVQSYIECINLHDPEAISALISAHHVFIDSLGAVISDPIQIKRGWLQYFTLFPDYKIEATIVAISGDSVVVCGTASATHAPSGIQWKIPAAWRAKVVNGFIDEWQVYADNKPVYALLAGSA